MEVNEAVEGDLVGREKHTRGSGITQTARLEPSFRQPPQDARKQAKADHLRGSITREQQHTTRKQSNCRHNFSSEESLGPLTHHKDRNTVAANSLAHKTQRKQVHEMQTGNWRGMNTRTTQPARTLKHTHSYTHAFTKHTQTHTHTYTRSTRFLASAHTFTRSHRQS
jgi:hypothetical protein